MVRKLYNPLKPLVAYLSLIVLTVHSAEEITPYKYSNQEGEKGLSAYQIPASSRFVLKRPNNSELIYYLSKPQRQSFPIAILCGGSSSKNDICSIIHFHRYFLKEFLDLGSAVLTIEQQGVDGDVIHVDEFMEHYTRSARLMDHKQVIEYITSNSPKGWNGKFILLGASEGGPLVTSLTISYSEKILATINWSGAGDWSWRDELWFFIKDLERNIPWYFKWYLKMRMILPKWMSSSVDFYVPHSREEYDGVMDEAIQDPVTSKEFMGMTYKYHADALKKYPKHEYDKLKTPFLVVAGTQDSIIQSCDLFVQKAKNSGASITYMRIQDMDHYIRHRPEVIEQSFKWLKEYL